MEKNPFFAEGHSPNPYLPKMDTQRAIFQFRKGCGGGWQDVLLGSKDKSKQKGQMRQIGEEGIGHKGYPKFPSSFFSSFRHC
jgi:hypothetical protein